VAFYLKEVRRFAEWAEKEGRPAGAPGDLLAVARQDAEAYFTALADEGRAKSTMRSRWISLRSFYRWAVEDDELDESPLARVHVPKANPPPVAVINADDISRLLRTCAGRDFADRRDAAIISLLHATGMRVSEACGLQLEDIDLVQRVALIHGKGDKDRVVRFDPKTAAHLDRYKRARARHSYASSPRFFLGYRGPLGRNGVGSMLQKRAAEAGITHVWPHKFRHTFADRWLSSGGSEGDLQRLGGWENAEIMRRYGASRATDRALKAYDNILGDT